jgi:hypothetical protein
MNKSIQCINNSQQQCMTESIQKENAISPRLDLQQQLGSLLFVLQYFYSQ